MVSLTGRLGRTVLTDHSTPHPFNYTMPDVNIVVAVVEEQARRAAAGKPPLPAVDTCFSTGTDNTPGDALLEDFGAALDEGTLLLTGLTLATATRALYAKGFPRDFIYQHLNALADLTAAAGNYHADITWDSTQADAVAIQTLWAARCPTLAYPPNGPLNPHTHPDSRLSPADHEDAHQAAALLTLLNRTGADITYTTRDLSFAGALTHLDIGPNPPIYYGELREDGIRTHGYMVPNGSEAQWRQTPGVAPTPARPAITDKEIAAVRAIYMPARSHTPARRER